MRRGFLFIESEGFTLGVRTYFGSDEDYAELQTFLVGRPEAGTVIPGAAPLRKLRWKDSRRQKSKRGGLRVVYIHVPDVQVLFMLDLYDKDEADDLSAADKRELRALAEELVRELRTRARKDT